jgi:flagellar basal-body rod modification protein FlgD
MAINPTTSTTSTTATSAAAAANKAKAKADQNVLGKDDFLKLMVAQMKNQDPMNPADDKDNIAQMAQFSSLEQITNLATATQKLADSMQMTQTLGLIGHTVTYTAADGTLTSGQVSAVDVAGGTPSLTVGDAKDIDPSAVSSVR